MSKEKNLKNSKKKNIKFKSNLNKSFWILMSQSQPQGPLASCEKNKGNKQKIKSCKNENK